MYPGKVRSKLSLAEELLTVYKTVSTREILRVRKQVAMMSEDGGCSERTVWRALSRLRKKNEKLTYIYTDLQRLLYDLQWILKFFHLFLIQPRKLSTKEVRRLDLIEEYVNKLSEIEGFGEYVRYLREIEGLEIDDLGAPNTK